MQSSHLSDQKCLFNVKSCFVVNDVDDNISGLLIIPSSERRTNANEQMLINLFVPPVWRSVLSYQLCLRRADYVSWRQRNFTPASTPAWGYFHGDTLWRYINKTKKKKKTKPFLQWHTRSWSSTCRFMAFEINMECLCFLFPSSSLDSCVHVSH